jgi:hypothetical protein
VPEVGRCPHGPERDPRRDRRGRCQRRHRVEPRCVDQGAPAQVIAGPGVIEALVLCLPPAASRLFPALVGEDDNAETHERQSYSAHD